MHATSVTDLGNEVKEATLKYLWRQWHTIGATATGSGQANAIVDPEALILTSLWMLDFEKRLVDVATSWVKINSSLLSIQRLRNLRDEFPKVVSERLSALAIVGMEDAKDLRWKSLRKRQVHALGARDNRVRAVEVGSPSWATLFLQLRRGIGVGAKADVLTFLIGTSGHQGDWSSVAMIAEGTRYTPAAVRRVADDLAAAQFIRVPSTADSDRAVQRMYNADPKAWAQLLRIGVAQTGWGYWRERFVFIIDLLTWIHGFSEREVSAYARDVEARELLTKHNAAFLRDRVVDPIDFSGADLGMTYLETVTRALISWLTNRG
ncbi:MAG: hypothetical protein ACREMW_03455 [Gemmatimonadales bacterium]